MFFVKVFYVMGKALSRELSCPCDRSCFIAQLWQLCWHTFPWFHSLFKEDNSNRSVFVSLVDESTENGGYILHLKERIFSLGYSGNKEIALRASSSLYATLKITTALREQILYFKSSPLKERRVNFQNGVSCLEEY